MPNVKRTENDRWIAESFQSKKGYVVVDDLGTPAAPASSGIHAAITTAAVITTTITNPDVPRVARIVSGGSGHNATGNVVLGGTDRRGNTISDTIALNGNTAVDGVKAFKTITSIDTTGVSGIGATATVVVGPGAALGLSRCQVADMSLSGSVDGVKEGTAPTMTTHVTEISQNTALFNTATDGAKHFRMAYVSTELTVAA